MARFRHGGWRRDDAIVAIVDGAFCAVGEDVVGGGDLGESFGRFLWGGGVAVWVVLEGECVEGSTIVFQLAHAHAPKMDGSDVGTSVH